MESAPVETKIQEELVTVPWRIWFASLVKLVTLNTLQGLPVYTDNAAAIAGGLSIGTPYKTATGQVMVVY